MIDLYRKMKKRNTNIPLFLIIFLIDVFYSLLSGSLLTFIEPSITEIPFFKSISLFEVFLISVIFGPLIETFIYQFLIIEILSKFKVNTNIIIGISTIIFALSHNYNIIYILVIIFPGVLYASYYIYLKVEKKHSPFLMIFVLHALSNLVAFVLDDVLGW